MRNPKNIVIEPINSIMFNNYFLNYFQPFFFIKINSKLKKKVFKPKK